jgi:hypothetical protein
MSHLRTAAKHDYIDTMYTLEGFRNTGAVFGAVLVAMPCLGIESHLVVDGSHLREEHCTLRGITQLGPQKRL